MAHLICPRCKTKLDLDGVPAGEKLLCSTCGACIRVARPVKPAAEPVQAVQALPAAPRLPRPVLAMPDPAYLRPAAAEVPVMARRERSSPKRRKQGMSGGLVAGLAGGAALGVTLIALVVFLLLRQRAEPELVQGEPAQQHAADNQPGDAAIAQPVALNVEPAKDAEAAPIGDLASGSLSVQTLHALKRASVYIRVQSGDRLSSGSGFLARVDGSTGFVVTNHHVVAPPSDRIIVVKKQVGPRVSGRPRGSSTTIIMQTKGFENPTYTVVFNSGTTEEKSFAAEVAAADAKNDLAILRIQDPPTGAAPVAIDPQTPLIETMPVYIFGFPFGELLATGKGNAAITVGKASVSSIRRDDQGQVLVVQINGDLNPGNSGGPVVDTRGRLVGIAVATLKGTQIGLLIPAARLPGLLASAPAQGAVALNPDPPPNSPPPNNPPPQIANPRPAPPLRPGRGNPPAVQPPAADKQPLPDAELDRLLASLSSGRFAIINNALVRLARARPVDEQRAKVIKAVTPLTKVTEFSADMHAVKVLGVWGDSEVVPTLIEVLDSTNVLAQIEAIRSLGVLKDPRAAEPLARRLVPLQFRMHASAALKEIGSAAEKAVLPYLKNSDLFVRTEVCNLLQVIGTQECLADLRAALADNEGLVRMAAERAVTAVDGRQK